MTERDEVIEECAKVADRLREQWRATRRSGAGEALSWAAVAAKDIADAIRSLRSRQS